jgi:phosphoglycolate phosphatase-like HAD superfamily hydrolase
VTADRPTSPSFLFDLDGTLIDSVYQHVIAWREALGQVGINLAVWKIHRRIGMSGGLFVAALARELGTELDRETLARLPSLHADAYIEKFESVRALPGSAQLLATLTENQVPRALGIGLLSGGYGREELFYSGAFRVYEDPADLLSHLDEVGVRRAL